MHLPWKSKPLTQTILLQVIKNILYPTFLRKVPHYRCTNCYRYFLQCCGSGMFIPDSWSEFFPSRIPDPHQSIYRNYFFNPKNCFLKLSELLSVLFIPYPDPGSGSWSWFLSFPDPGSRIQGAKGTGSRIRIRNTWFFSIYPLAAVPFKCSHVFLLD